jgi:hypothetical protein
MRLHAVVNPALVSGPRISIIDLHDVHNGTALVTAEMDLFPGNHDTTEYFGRHISCHRSSVSVNRRHCVSR